VTRDLSEEIKKIGYTFRLFNDIKEFKDYITDIDYPYDVCIGMYLFLRFL